MGIRDTQVLSKLTTLIIAEIKNVRNIYIYQYVFDNAYLYKISMFI